MERGCGRPRDGDDGRARLVVSRNCRAAESRERGFLLCFVARGRWDGTGSSNLANYYVQGRTCARCRPLMIQRQESVSDPAQGNKQEATHALAHVHDVAQVAA
jgi:hypothetical protein